MAGPRWRLASLEGSFCPHEYFRSTNGSSEFKEYGLYETYEVPVNAKFQLKVLEDSAYTCCYL